jgi:hypothetical protein
MYSMMRWWLIFLLIISGLTALPAQSSNSRTKKLKVPDAKVTLCEALPLPTTGRVCDVSTGDGGLLIKGNILAVDEIYQGGEVLVDDTGLILHVGCSGERPQALAAVAENATQITCAEGVVSPGLINAHDHLFYNQSYPFAKTTERYEHRNDWRSDPGITAPAFSEWTEVAWSELRQILVGTTSIAGSGGEIGFLRNIDVDLYPVYDDLLWNIFEEWPTVIVTETFPLENPGDYTQNEGDCSEYPYLGKTYDGADVYVPHLAEGINAAAHNEFACLSSTERNGKDLVDEHFSMIHGVALAAMDGRVLATDGASLIWSPRSNVSLYGNTAPVRMLKNQGVLVSLSTDWTPSGSMHLGRELACADELSSKYFDHAFTDRELWLMTTYNPALALGVDQKIGSLRLGLFGDIAIYDGRGKDNPYRAIIGADATSTVLVLRRSSLPFPFIGGPDYVGSIALYGDAGLLESMPVSLHDLSAADVPLCEPLSVCGVEKLICPLRETWYFPMFGLGDPYSLEALTSANASSYPLFFCNAPPDEPTCVPYRPGEYAGTSDAGPASTGDRDGDGVIDRLDNCRKVFNPIRPMDEGAQADADGDGKGDACDKCPLDVGPVCLAVDPYSGAPVLITDGD